MIDFRVRRKDSEWIMDYIVPEPLRAAQRTGTDFLDTLHRTLHCLILEHSDEPIDVLIGAPLSEDQKQTLKVFMENVYAIGINVARGKNIDVTYRDVA